MRYSLSVLLARIDEEYAVFPHMAKKKRAGDKPSHLVLKFLTGEMIVNFLTNAPFGADGPHLSVEHGRRSVPSS